MAWVDSGGRFWVVGHSAHRAVADRFGDLQGVGSALQFAAFSGLAPRGCGRSEVHVGKSTVRHHDRSAPPGLRVVVRLDVLHAAAARDDLYAADQDAAVNLAKVRAVEHRDDVGLAVVAQQHGDPDASAWLPARHALHVYQVADRARVLHCLW